MPNVAKPGRNDACPCGSGRKFKRCCAGVGPERGALDAVRHLRRSVALAPGVARTHHHLGVALQHAGDEEAAMESLRSALLLDPTLAEAHGLLGDSTSVGVSGTRR